MPAPRPLLRVALCLLIAGVAACAPLERDAAQPVMTVQERAAVAEAVRQRLRAERESELADLQVSVESDGTVRLSGRTYTLAMADRAVQIARTTPDVIRVRNDILALPETPR